MTDRLKHVWEVPVQYQNGEQETVTVASYWDPDKPSTREAIELAAKVETTKREKRECVVVGSAVLVA
jgi:hypothetical protein